MKAKVLELRDSMTFIPLLCVDMNPDSDAQHYLLRRCGYPCHGEVEPNIAISRLSADGGPLQNDPHHWGDRTFAVAHDFIIKYWHVLRDGDVVDVEHILGETPTRKRSEREGYLP